MRTLILLRHAKSDYPPGVPDVDRPLSPRGVRDAAAAGEWLRAAFPAVDLAIVSPALRARDTWQRVEEQVTASRVRLDDRIYADWGSGLPQVLADVEPDAHTVVIVGHNPGIEEYAVRLSGKEDSPAKRRMLEKYPTSGIAVVEFAGSWGDQSSALVTFAVPRGSS